MVEGPGGDSGDLGAELADGLIADADDGRTGLAVVFCAHTSASLLIQENADPDADPRSETLDEDRRVERQRAAQDLLGARRRARWRR